METIGVAVAGGCLGLNVAMPFWPLSLGILASWHTMVLGSVCTIPACSSGIHAHCFGLQFWNPICTVLTRSSGLHAHCFGLQFSSTES